MRIAQVAPLTETVPPKLYGGTERVVSVLTEELVRRGHEVTLFASGDSTTAARLVSCCERSLRLAEVGQVDALAYAVRELDLVFGAREQFDVIHNHLDYIAFSLARQTNANMLTTCHGRLDRPETRQIYEHFADTSLVSISNDQRRPLPGARWVATVYNGIDFSAYELHEEPGKYLAFLGRISPEKRVDRAIDVARALDMPLKIAAKVDPVDRAYFEHAIRPQLDHSNIEFVGEVNDAEKNDFLGEAYAYLFPIDWPEPFGLTMIESMACGTPVVAIEAGSVSEVVADGVAGYVCKSLREFIECVPKAGELNRQACRNYAESRFSAAAMADGYEAAYETLVNTNLNRSKPAWRRLFPMDVVMPSRL
jgi:glycosyltransferase involved in cell wall biosynthesis